MKKYETYKDSGVEWIGEIPEGWEASKIKFEVDMVLGKMLEDKEPNNNDGNYTLEPYLKSRNIGMLELFNAIEQVDKMWFNEKEKALYELKEGDLVMNEGGDIGKVSLWNNSGFKCYIQNSVHKLTPHKDKLNPTYLQYLIFYVTAKGYFYKVVSSISIAHLTKEKLAETPIILPPLSEQRAIASYLDHKVGQIDVSVSAISKQIDDLKAYRQSVISEAVTKGLNPNATMKDSGVEWIGEIPESWGILKLKRVASIQTGGTPSTNVEKYWANGTIDWYTPGDFSDEHLCLTDSSRKISSVAADEHAVKMFPQNTILMVGIGATIGKVALSEKRCSANQQINGIIFLGNILPKYGMYFLHSARNCVRSLSNSATLPIINQAVTGEIRICIPTLPEQRAIVSYLDAKTSKIDATIKSLEAQRDDLKALKQSIISEAVTGKIDVRDWKPNNEQ